MLRVLLRLGHSSKESSEAVAQAVQTVACCAASDALSAEFHTRRKLFERVRIVISAEKPLKGWRVFNLPLNSLDALKLPVVSAAAAPANTSAAAAAAVRAVAGPAARPRAQPQPARPVSLAAVNPVRAHIAEVRSFFFILFFNINPNPKSGARTAVGCTGLCEG